MLNPRVLEELSACNPERWKRAIRSFRCSVLHVCHGMSNIAGNFPTVEHAVFHHVFQLEEQWRRNWRSVDAWQQPSITFWCTSPVIPVVCSSLLQCSVLSSTAAGTVPGRTRRECIQLGQLGFTRLHQTSLTAVANLCTCVLVLGYGSRQGTGVRKQIALVAMPIISRCCSKFRHVLVMAKG